MKSQFRLGNLSIIGAFICDKEMRNSTNILILNLSLADLVVSTFIEAFKLVGILAGKKFFDQTPIFCRFVAAICFITCGTSLISIGLLALNRFEIMRIFKILFISYFII
jgi:hypothetical protein